MVQPAETYRAAARRAWPYFAPIWAVAVGSVVGFQALAARPAVYLFFWAGVVPAWGVAFFVPDVALLRGVVTLRQRLVLGLAVPLLLFFATTTVWNLAWVATH